MPNTSTQATLELSASAYYEIALALRYAGYDHAFKQPGPAGVPDIDMDGIRITRRDDRHGTTQPIQLPAGRNDDTPSGPSLRSSMLRWVDRIRGRLAPRQPLQA